MPAELALPARSSAVYRIRPRGGNQRARSIRQYQRQMKLAAR